MFRQPPNSINAQSPPGERRRRASWWVGCGLCLLAGMGWRVTPVQSQDAYINRESRIKAGYVLNFAKYVVWPREGEESGGGPRPFMIGVVGVSDVGKVLAGSASRKVGEKSITVRHFKAIEEFEACHILFVPAGQKPELVRACLKRAALDKTTLIVGEEEGFAHRDGMLNFFVEGNSVRFEINARAVEQSQLRMSSKLLSLGRIVNVQ